MSKKTLRLRLCLLQFKDHDGPGVFAAGWDEDPDDPHAQDAIRLKDVREISGIGDKFITSTRFATVEVPVDEDLVLPVQIEEISNT
jgi:hypothetical protein